jgi:phage-related holin
MIKNVLAVIFSAIISFYAPVQSLLLPILWLVIIDIVTGVYCARIVEKKPLNSRGLFKKLPQITMFLVAITAALHANPFFVTFGLPEYQAVKLVFAFYGLYELFSILENLGKSGLPVAKQIINILTAKLPDDVKKEFEQVNPEKP